MSAFRSSTLRLRTAAMKLPKWPLPGPRVGSTFSPRLGQRLGLVAPLAGELAADDRPVLEMGDVADLLALDTCRSSGRGPRR